tara:strand:- start:6398 stop:6928 length:531 start_codon:yes stop_codon:yes gene_type:complete
MMTLSKVFQSEDNLEILRRHLNLESHREVGEALGFKKEKVLALVARMKDGTVKDISSDEDLQALAAKVGVSADRLKEFHEKAKERNQAAIERQASQNAMNEQMDEQRLHRREIHEADSLGLCLACVSYQAEDKGRGYCRHNPPVLWSTETSLGSWPLVYERSWCMKFESRPREEHC